MLRQIETSPVTRITLLSVLWFLELTGLCSPGAYIEADVRIDADSVVKLVPSLVCYTKTKLSEYTQWVCLVTDNAKLRRCHLLFLFFVLVHVFSKKENHDRIQMSKSRNASHYTEDRY